MKRVIASSVALLLAIGASSLFLSASTVMVPSHAWAPTGDLAEARAGAAAVLLFDGVVLITGGSGPEGSSASAERYNVANGTFGPAASMLAARANHTATSLSDGRVLVIGGHSAAGTVTGAAEIYDPATNAWTPAGTLVHARAGHTATLLSDGRVLVAGGENADGALATLEVYSPVFEEFSLVAAPLTTARMRHAAALAGDKVLIAGGWDGSAALASVDVFDPANDSVSAGPAMLTPRAEHTATTLMNGDVLVAGGMGTQDEGELQSAEVFKAADVAFVATTAMASKRRNHIALLLPHNNSVLIAGGWSEGAASATAELYRAWQDGGIFVPTGSSAASRNWSVGSALSFAASATNRSGAADGLVLVAGGEGTSSAELYGFATVKTDKDDYQPGDVVYVSGSGWVPNQPVTFYVRELPAEHYARLVTIEADGAGNIHGAKLFDVEQHHLNVRFLLTAADGVSQAHMTFTDANPQSVTVSSPTSVAVTQGGTAVFGNVTVVKGGTDASCQITLSLVAGIGTGLPAGAAPVFGTNPLTMTTDNVVSTFSVTTLASTPTGTFTFQVAETIGGGGCQGPAQRLSNLVTLIVNSANVDTTTTASNASATYGDASVTIDAQVGPAAVGGTVLITIKDGPTPIGTVTSGIVAGGVASANFSLSGVNAGIYSIEASYSGATGFKASDNATQIPQPTLTVNKAPTTTVVTFEAGPYTYRGSAFTATAQVTGIGGLAESVPVVYTGDCVSVTAANGCTATATYATTTNYAESTDSKSITITPATTTTVVTFEPGPYTYRGSAFTATAQVTGAGGLAQSVAVTYTGDCVNVTTADGCTATATYAATTNYAESTDSKSITITPATTTTVVTFEPGPYTYRGSAFTATAQVTGAAGLAQSVPVIYTGDCVNVTTANGCTATATYAATTNYAGSTDSKSITITPAPTTTVVTFEAGPYTYRGSAFAATAQVTGAGGLAENVPVIYTGDCVNVTAANGCTGTATYAATTNYAESTDSKSITISPAPTTTVVTFEAGPYTYRGSAFTATAQVTGAGGLAQGVPVIYTGDCVNVTAANGCTATGTYAATTNYTGSTDTKSITILKASSTTLVTFEPGPYVFRSTPFTATAQVTGAGLNSSVAVVYSGDCTFVTIPNGCTATATYSGDVNHFGSSDTKSITILTACSAFNGFLSPIGGAIQLNTGGSLLDPVRAFKLNSTIPVKFSATCSGTQLLTGIHTLQATKYSNSGTPESAIDATPTDAATTGNQFRLSGVEWHFNLSTKALGGGAQGIWLLEATLFDGSKYSVWVEIKK